MEEEKKSIEAELEHQTSEEVQDSECEKETVEQESKEEPTERRGLFGARSGSGMIRRFSDFIRWRQFT
ncbi:MAG: hypothetical protein V8S96_02400 [Lachnospiraceae bacterium]